MHSRNFENIDVRFKMINTCRSFVDYVSSECKRHYLTLTLNNFKRTKILKPKVLEFLSSVDPYTGSGRSWIEKIQGHKNTTVSHILISDLLLGIIMPKIGFLENACMTKKFCLEVVERVSVIYKQFLKNSKTSFFDPKFTILPYFFRNFTNFYSSPRVPALTQTFLINLWGG